MEKISIRKIEDFESSAPTFYTFLLIGLTFLTQSIPGIMAYVFPALLTMTISLLNALGIGY